MLTMSKVIVYLNKNTGVGGGDRHMTLTLKSKVEYMQLCF
jgi:hypothetical protein